VKWRGDDAGEGLGEGSISLTIDTGAHVVTGLADGPIGDVLLSGAVDDGKVTASVRRKNATDRGLTGTLIATLTAERVEGMMRLSFGDAHIIREATFRLTAAPSP
jgi:hypothetical protein